MIETNLLSCADAARLAGVSEATVSRAIGNGSLVPHCRIGRAYVFDRKEVERFCRVPRPKPGPKKKGPRAEGQSDNRRESEIVAKA